jgi:hypothetical protein
MSLRAKTGLTVDVALCDLKIKKSFHQLNALKLIQEKITRKNNSLNFNLYNFFLDLTCLENLLNSPILLYYLIDSCDHTRHLGSFIRPRKHVKQVKNYGYFELKTL